MILYLKEFETFPVRKLLKSAVGEVHIDYTGLKQIIELEHIVNIQQSGEEYFCQGEINVQVELECARCLTEFKKNLTSKTDFIVCSKEKYEQEKNVLDNEDYAFFKDSNLTVDLSDIERQAIILAVSLKPVCSESCPGICSKCGVNLNEKSCNCKKENYDARWEGLKKLSSSAQKEGK